MDGPAEEGVNDCRARRVRSRCCRSRAVTSRRRSNEIAAALCVDAPARCAGRAHIALEVHSVLSGGSTIGARPISERMALRKSAARRASRAQRGAMIR